MNSQEPSASTGGRSPDRAAGPAQPRWLQPDEDDAPAGSALTRRRIVLTALALVERHGLNALTMRRVASELDVTPMSLYNHVADKAELIDLMVDYVIEDAVATSAPDTGDWEQRIRALCQHNHDVWKAHPGIVRVYVEGVTLGPNGLANLEHGVAILRQGGFTDDDAAHAVMLLYRLSMSTLLVAKTRPVHRDLVATAAGATKEERMEAYFSALPREKIHNIEATVMALSGTSIDFGLDVILSGLKAHLAETKGGKGLDGAPVPPSGGAEAAGDNADGTIKASRRPRSETC
ncbi:MAG: TetR/AcrR family transcriptional regulator [Acidimicrobiales bacterium]